ncbi:hypothetical protein PIB30_060815 [Stylosanthes scabra]|uniref:Uncharacterized protein n=1 Tax=Stylosanthes scabra TaxID=79078 RepID=A0ABU6QK59_9FABA|nr:hypothetical protein [Stylosanthes scabra]
MNVVRGYGRGRWSNSKLGDALGVMDIEGCAWMLKWSGGTTATARPPALARAAARALGSTFEGLCPGHTLARPYRATARVRRPILDALYRRCAVARPCACQRTTRATVRYPRASSRWDELLSVEVTFAGARLCTVGRAIAGVQNQAEWAPI